MKNHNPLVIMFDLENTLVDNWNNGIPLDKKIKVIERKIEKLKNEGHEVIEYGIFSFAVDHAFEKDDAISMVNHIFPNLLIKEYYVPCFEDLKKLCNFNINAFQKWELVNLMGKEGMFSLWTEQFPDKDFFLFDDFLRHQLTVIKRSVDANVSQTIEMWRV